MPLKLRPTGVGFGTDKTARTTPSAAASGRSAASTTPTAVPRACAGASRDRQRSDEASGSSGVSEEPGRVEGVGGSWKRSSLSGPKSMCRDELVSRALTLGADINSKPVRATDRRNNSHQVHRFIAAERAYRHRGHERPLPVWTVPYVVLGDFGRFLRFDSSPRPPKLAAC